MTTTSDLRERPKPNNSTDYKGATWRVGEAKSSDLTQRNVCAVSQRSWTSLRVRLRCETAQTFELNEADKPVGILLL